MDTTEQESITGRDDLIVAQALLYAIKYIDSLPTELQELSNRDDMARILLAVYPGFVDEGRNLILDRDDSLTAAHKAHLKTPDLSETLRATVDAARSAGINNGRGASHS
jgi:hypothetical protein